MQIQGVIELRLVLFPLTGNKPATTRGAEQRRPRARQLTSGPPPAIEFDFSSPEKIPTFLGLVATMVLCKKLDAKAAHAICHAGDTALRAYSLGAIKSQLDRVERRLESERTRPGDPREIKDLLHFEGSQLTETQELLEKYLEKTERKLPDDEEERTQL